MRMHTACAIMAIDKPNACMVPHDVYVLIAVSPEACMQLPSFTLPTLTADVS